MAETVEYHWEDYVGSQEWANNPSYMTDGILTNYASTDIDEDLHTVNDSECDGSELGIITKVELTAYAYGDGGDQIRLALYPGWYTLGAWHTVTPTATPGWLPWIDVTLDADGNFPSVGFLGSNDWQTNAHGDTWRGQQFTTGNYSFSIKAMLLPLWRILSPGIVNVDIYALDGSGHPTGESLSSGSIDGDTLPTSDTGYSSILMSAFTLVASTQYGYIVTAPDGDASNYVRMRIDNDYTYTGGELLSSIDAGENWTALDWQDAVFTIVGWEFADFELGYNSCRLVYNTVAKANLMYCAAVKVRITYELGPIPQAVAGALTLAGTALGWPSKAFTAALTLAGDVTEKIAVSWNGALSFVGAAIKKSWVSTFGALTFLGVPSMKKALSEAVAGALTFAGDAVGKTAKVIVGTLALAGTVVKKTTHAFVGALSFLGTVAKKATAAVSGALSFDGIVSLIKSFVRAYAGELTLAGVATGKMIKVLTGALTLSGIVFKRAIASLDGALTFIGTSAQEYIAGMIYKVVDGTLTLIGIVTKKSWWALDGAQTFVGTVIKKADHAFAGALTFVGDTFKKGSRAIDGALTFIGTLVTNFEGTFELALEGALTSSADIARKTTHAFAGALSFIGVVATNFIGQIELALDGAVTFAGVATRKPAKILAGALTLAGTVIKWVPRSFAGVLTPAGTVIKRVTHIFAGTLTLAGTVLKWIPRSLDGALSFVGIVTKWVPRGFAGVLSFVGDLATNFEGVYNVVLSGALTLGGNAIKKGKQLLSGEIKF